MQFSYLSFKDLIVLIEYTRINVPITIVPIHLRLLQLISVTNLFKIFCPDIRTKQTYS